MNPFIVLLLMVSGQLLANEKPLKIYCYDALSGRDSFGEYLSQEFSKKTGVKVQFISFGTAGEAVNQIVLEGKNTQADILMGADEILFQRLRDRDLFEPLEPEIKKELEPSLIKTNEVSFLPFDYGYLAFVYDSNRTEAIVDASLKTFPMRLKKEQKIVLQDPRTSSLGIEFLVWTKEAMGLESKLFWTQLAPHILTVSPGWSGAYELFLKKQADFVLSYTTSPAYHRIREKRAEIKSVLFKEGHFRQVEGVLVLKTSRQKEAAKKFLSFVVGKEAQEKIATFQWMYPARKKTVLPKEFQEIPIPKSVNVDFEKLKNNKDQWIQEWALLLSQGSK